MSYPTYLSKGSMVYLTGGVSTSDYYPLRIPKMLTPKKSDLFHNISGSGNIARIDTRSWGAIANVFRDSSGISLEGINYSIFNGERIKLKSNFYNYSGNNGYWSYAQALIDNGVVSLKGLIVISRSARSSNGVTKVEDENSRSRGINLKLGRKNKKNCANTAVAYGQKFIKMDSLGNCSSGKYYNITKPSWNEFRKILKKYPGTIDRQVNITKL